MTNEMDRIRGIPPRLPDSPCPYAHDTGFFDYVWKVQRPRCTEWALCVCTCAWCNLAHNRPKVFVDPIKNELVIDRCNEETGHGDSQ